MTVTVQQTEDRAAVEIRGGFFWLPRDDGYVISHHPKGCPPTSVGVIECTFMAKPRWWQLRRWHRAVRAWVGPA